jgi:hypothetical protein
MTPEELDLIERACAPVDRLARGVSPQRLIHDGEAEPFIRAFVLVLSLLAAQAQHGADEHARITAGMDPF